jgi:hypothetical protein
MKIYNVLGFAAIAFQVLVSALLAPPWLGPWWGIVVGVGYLVVSWFLGGLYLSDMIHLGSPKKTDETPLTRPLPKWVGSESPKIFSKKTSDMSFSPERFDITYQSPWE